MIRELIEAALPTVRQTLTNMNYEPMPSDETIRFITGCFAEISGVYTDVKQVGINLEVRVIDKGKEGAPSFNEALKMDYMLPVCMDTRKYNIGDRVAVVFERNTMHIPVIVKQVVHYPFSNLPIDVICLAVCQTEEDFKAFVDACSKAKFKTAEEYFQGQEEAQKNQNHPQEDQVEESGVAEASDTVSSNQSAEILELPKRDS